MEEGKIRLRFKPPTDRNYLLNVQYRIDSKIDLLCREAKKFCNEVSRINFKTHANFNPIFMSLQYFDFLDDTEDPSRSDNGISRSGDQYFFLVTKSTEKEVSWSVISVDARKKNIPGPTGILVGALMYPRKYPLAKITNFFGNQKPQKNFLVDSEFIYL